jgi:hypothetical protein
MSPFIFNALASSVSSSIGDPYKSKNFIKSVYCPWISPKIFSGALNFNTIGWFDNILISSCDNFIICYFENWNSWCSGTFQSFGLSNFEINTSKI